MPNWEAYKEAYQRGILPEDKKLLYEEAVNRGLTGEKPNEQRIQKIETLRKNPIYLDSIEEKGTISKSPPWWMRGIVKPTMEYGGLSFGGAIPALSGLAVPPAAMAAIPTAGAGYALGKRLYEGLESSLYGTTEPNQPEPSMGRTIKDIQSGMLMESTGQLIGKTGGKILEKVYNPLGEVTQTPASKELLKIYEQYGLKPLPSEIVGESGFHAKSLGILESVLGYRPIAGDVMLKDAMVKMKTLNDIRQKMVDKGIGGKSLESVGNAIKKEANSIISKYSDAKGEKLNLLVEQFTSQVGTLPRQEAGQKFIDIMGAERVTRKAQEKGLWKDVRSLLPKKGEDIVPISEETKAVMERLVREESSKIPGLRDKKIINLLDPIVNKPKLPEGVTEEMLRKDPTLRKLIEVESAKDAPKFTWEGLQNSRSDLLGKIRGILIKEKQSTKESRVYSYLADALEKDMSTFAENQPGKVWETYLSARQNTRNLHEIYDKDMLKIMHKNPEEILGRIITKKDLTLLNQIKDATGDAGIEPLRKGFFKQMLDKSTDGNIINPKKLGVNLKNMDEVINEFITPEQKELLNNIVKKGQFYKTHTDKMKTYEFLDTLTGTSNEAVVNNIIKPNNIENVKLAKKLLPPDRLKEIESLTLEKLLKVSGEGNVLPVSSAKALKPYKMALQEIMEPSTYKEMNDFIHLGLNMKRVENLAKNASQTGQVLMGSSILMQAIKNPLGTVGTIGIPYIMAKMYTSDTARRWLLGAIKMNPNTPQAISAFTKAWIMAVGNMVEPVSQEE